MEFIKDVCESKAIFHNSKPGDMNMYNNDLEAKMSALSISMCNQMGAIDKLNQLKKFKIQKKIDLIKVLKKMKIKQGIPRKLPVLRTSEGREVK